MSQFSRNNINSLQSDITLHDVERDKLPTAAWHRKHSRVPDQFTSPDRQLPELRTLSSEVAETIVGYITFAEIKRPDPWAAWCEGKDGGVGDWCTCSSVEIPKLVTMRDQVSESSVGHTLTLGHG